MSHYRSDVKSIAYYEYKVLLTSNQYSVRTFASQKMTVFSWALLLSLLALSRADSPIEETKDGTCEVNADGSSTCANNELPDLPPQQESGHYDIGYGTAQLVEADRADDTRATLREMMGYMQNTVMKDPQYKDVRSSCRNEHELCAFWAMLGECEKNPSYMDTSCAPVCQTCEKLSFETRCPMSEEALRNERIWPPGQLDIMFRRIVKDHDNVNILSSPDNALGEFTSPPWVITVDDFLTAEECETLIDLGAKRGYELSKDVGKRKADGTYDSAESDGRTSTNAWCVQDCYNHTTSQQVLKKLEDLTGIPDSHGEYLQLLKYEVGQFYEHHHDYIMHHMKRSMGPRILTVFLYLNDVEAGGGTHFNDLDITVEPKRGRALLWPSVTDMHPDDKDRRTHHEALKVEKGIKYGANAWMHQRDFKEPYSRSCI